MAEYPVLSRGSGRPSGLVEEAGNKLPTEVVPGFMYLGGEGNALDKTTLDALGINAVLNASDNVPHFHLDDPSYHYHRVAVGDFPNWSERIADRLEQAVDWLEQQRQAGRKALVHCKMGMSRSTTCVLGWMIKHGGSSLSEAFCHVKQRRKIANPNPGHSRAGSADRLGRLPE